MATSTEIKQRANTLADKTDVNSITPKEVGGIMYDLASHGENVLRNGGTLGIRKVYKSVAAMEADSTNPKDFWGDPIKKGNLVVIYDGTTTGVDNNKIYAFMKPGWELATKLDAAYATKAETDAKLAELGSKVLNNSFIGKGVKFSSIHLKGLMPNTLYKLYIPKLWSIESVEGIEDTSYKFAISYFLNGTENRIVGVYRDEELRESYEFTTPDSFDDIMIGGRAVEGEEVFFYLFAMTEIIEVLEEIKKYDNCACSAYTPNYGLLKEFIERNDSSKGITIKFKKTSTSSNMSIFLVCGIRNGVFFSFNPNIPDDYMIGDEAVFEIMSGYSLVMDYKGGENANVRIVESKLVTNDVILLAACSYGNFIYGAFEYLIQGYKSKEQVETLQTYTKNKINVIDRSLTTFFGQGYYNSEVLEGVYYLNKDSKPSIRENSEIYNLSPFIPIKVGDIIEWSGGFAGTADEYPVLALFDSGKEVINFLASSIDPRTWKYTINASVNYAYCRFSFRKDCIGAYIKVNEEKVFEWDGVPFKDTELKNTELFKSKSKLFIGNLINSGSKGGDIEDIESENSKRVITKSACCVPFEGVTIKTKLPYGISCYFWIGLSNGNISSTSGSWLTDGDVYTFPNSIKAYRCVFRADSGSDILASDIKRMVDNEDIAFYYDKEDSDVVNRNINKSTNVGALRRKLLGKPLEQNGMNGMPIFAHISDLHGDAQRLINCMDYCDHIEVDALLATGDFSMYKYKDYCSFQEDIAASHNTPYCFCIGNHEAYPSGESNLYEDCIYNLATSQGYLGEGESITEKCYWYKDFAGKKIRVVAINYYENGIYNGYLGQEQLLWFVNTLKSTPIGYGIIIMLHSPEDKIVVESPYDVFRQKHRVTTYQENGFYVGDRPIMKVVDAFIERTSVLISYTESNGESVAVNADFSDVDASVEFIAYACGHRHEDWIGYYDNSVNKQLSLGITAGVALYGDSSNAAWANQEDLPRGGKGVCQDAFNIYAIDREQGVVKVVRIGADVTESFEDRKIMIIPYR